MISPRQKIKDIAMPYRFAATDRDFLTNTYIRNPNRITQIERANVWHKSSMRAEDKTNSKICKHCAQRTAMALEFIAKCTMCRRKIQ
jgi:hypothetical protein